MLGLGAESPRRRRALPFSCHQSSSPSPFNHRTAIKVPPFHSPPPVLYLPPPITNNFQFALLLVAPGFARRQLGLRKFYFASNENPWRPVRVLRFGFKNLRTLLTSSSTHSNRIIPYTTPSTNYICPHDGLRKRESRLRW